MEVKGFCQCGCGGRTPIAARTYSHKGIRKGEPLPYLPRHSRHPARTRVSPNPSGLCKCGCGEKTEIARWHRNGRGWVKGEPIPYIAGHHRRKSGVEYVIDPETGCWIWQRGKRGEYGVITILRKAYTAHRVVYERIIGPIPDGHDLDHVCANKACVNPDHLQPVPKNVHMRIETRRGTFRKTPIDIQETALALNGTMSARAAAKAVGIDRGTVCRLWKRGCPK